MAFSLHKQAFPEENRVFTVIVISKGDLLEIDRQLCLLDVLEMNNYPLYVAKMTAITSEGEDVTRWFPLWTGRVTKLRKIIANQLMGMPLIEQHSSSSGDSGEDIIYLSQYMTGFSVYFKKYAKESLESYRNRILYGQKRQREDEEALLSPPLSPIELFQRPLSEDVLDIEELEMRFPTPLPKRSRIDPIVMFDVIDEGVIDEQTYGHLSDAESEATVLLPNTFNDNEEPSLFASMFGDLNSQDKEDMIDNEITRKKGKSVRKGKLFAYKFKDETIYDIMADEFKRWQITKDITEAVQGNLNLHPLLKDNCFVYAMRQLLERDQLLSKEEKERLLCQLGKKNYETNVTFSSIRTILVKARLHNVIISIQDYPDFQKDRTNSMLRRISYAGIGSKITNTIENPITFKLCRVGDHYLVHEILRDREKMKLFDINNQSKVCSGGLLSKAIQKEMVVPVTWNDSGIITGPARTKTKLHINPITFAKDAFDRKEYEVLESYKEKKKEKNITFEEMKLKWTNWFCDFETFKDKPSDDSDIKHYHKVYCVSGVSWDLTKKNTFYGKDCFKDLVKWIYTTIPADFLKIAKKIKKWSPILHFHNLKYDSCFVLEVCDQVLHNIEKGNKIISFSGLFFLNKTKYVFKCKDTLGVLSCSLANTISMYWAKIDQPAIRDKFKKEIFPYDALTSQNQEYCSLEDAFKYINPDEQQQFVKNIEDLGLFTPEHEQNSFNIKKYCGFYCERDCELLCMAWKQCRTLYLGEDKTIDTPFSYDINKFLTVPSLSYKHFHEKCFVERMNDKNIYGFHSALRCYEQLSVRGGRCMTRDNESWYLKEGACKIQDFDAVSLYPSAINRLYCFLGIPKRLPEEFRGKDAEKLLYYTAKEQEQRGDHPNVLFDGFTVTCYVKKVRKHLHFPILSYKTKENGCHWTNIPEPNTPLVLNEVNLMDIIKYHDADIEIVDGYVWDEGKSFTCQKVIKELFEFRYIAQSQENPLESTVKLMMNSSYGKSVLKMIKNEKKYVNGKDFDGHLERWGFKIEEFQEVSDKLWSVTHSKEYYDSKGIFNGDGIPNWWGTRILAMSKRIMSEVMCTAEDLGIMIYYTDTDSMLIDADGLSELEFEFKEKFGRDLIGRQMGKFHSDFKYASFCSKELRSSPAEETIVVAKKIYACRGQKIEDKGLLKPVLLHKRMKGVPKFAIDDYCPENPMKLYEDIFNSSEVDIPWELTGSDKNTTIHHKPVVLPICDPTKGRFVFTKSKKIFTDMDLTRKITNKNKIRHIIDKDGNETIISISYVIEPEKEKTLIHLQEDHCVISTKI